MGNRPRQDQLDFGDGVVLPRGWRYVGEVVGRNRIKHGYTGETKQHTATENLTQRRKNLRKKDIVMLAAWPGTHRDELDWHAWAQRWRDPETHRAETYVPQRKLTDDLIEQAREAGRGHELIIFPPKWSIRDLEKYLDDMAQAYALEEEERVLGEGKPSTVDAHDWDNYPTAVGGDVRTESTRNPTGLRSDSSRACAPRPGVPSRTQPKKNT